MHSYELVAINYKLVPTIQVYCLLLHVVYIRRPFQTGYTSGMCCNQRVLCLSWLPGIEEMLLWIALFRKPNFIVKTQKQTCRFT